VLAKLRSRVRRPSAATVIAVAALVFAISGYAVAGPKDKDNKDEATVTTLIGGPVDTDEAGVETPIPLGAGASFTQKAGEPVMVVLHGTFTPQPGTELCDVTAVVTDEDNPADLGAEVVELWERGFEGMFTDSEILVAPPVDTERNLRAFAIEAQDHPGFEGFGCDEEDPESEPPDTGNDVWTVEVRVTIVTLRN
jgi:hypothetical protein